MYKYSQEYFENMRKGWNRISYDLIASFAREGLRRFSPGVVLDLGCGNGIYGPVLTEGGAELYGIDMALESVALCRAAGYSDVILCPAQKIDVQSGKFDMVFSSEVIEHVEPYDKMLSEIYRVLKPGGGLVLTTTCYATSIYQFLLHWKGGAKELMANLFLYFRGYRNAHDRQKFINQWCFEALGGHYHGFIKKELASDIKNRGFDLIACKIFYAVNPLPLFDNYDVKSVLKSNRTPIKKFILLAGVLVSPPLNSLFKSLKLLGNNIVIIARKR